MNFIMPDLFESYGEFKNLFIVDEEQREDPSHQEKAIK